MYTFDADAYIRGARALEAGESAVSARGYLYPAPVAQFYAVALRFVSAGTLHVGMVISMQLAWLATTVGVAAASVSPRMALLAGGSVLALPLFWEGVELGNVEPFIFLLLAFAVWKSAERESVAAGAALGLAAAIKVSPALLVVAVAATLRTGDRKNSRQALQLMIAASGAFLCIWCIDLPENLEFLRAGTSSDASRMLRGVGVSYFLRETGIPALSLLKWQPITVTALLMAFVHWQKLSVRRALLLAAAVLPTFNPLTSGYSFAPAVLVFMDALGRIERGDHHPSVVAAATSSLAVMVAIGLVGPFGEPATIFGSIVAVAFTVSAAWYVSSRT